MAAGRVATRTAELLSQGALGEYPPPWTPGQFGIIVDSREQAPWVIPAGVHYDVQALPFGDYTVAGFGSRVAVERKSLSDYVHTVFGDWPRFRSELKGLRGYDLAFIVVEATEDDVRAGKYRPGKDSSIRNGASRGWAHVLDGLAPSRVLESAAKIYALYGVPVFWKGSPHRASTFAFDVMRTWHKAQLTRDVCGVSVRENATT